MPQASALEIRIVVFSCYISCILRSDIEVLYGQILVVVDPNAITNDQNRCNNALAVQVAIRCPDDDGLYRLDFIYITRLVFICLYYFACLDVTYLHLI